MADRGSIWRRLDKVEYGSNGNGIADRTLIQSLALVCAQLEGAQMI